MRGPVMTTRTISTRNAGWLALTVAVLSVAGTLLVLQHPFTDEDRGTIRLMHNGRPAAAPPGAERGKPEQVPPGWSHGDKVGWNGGEVPPGWTHRDHGKSADTPPGWSPGDKDGWKGKDVPPGRLHHGDHGKPRQDDTGDKDDQDRGKRREHDR